MTPPIRVAASSLAPWGYHENGAPAGPDGAPLWDVAEWGTRGPPWRASLVAAARGASVPPRTDAPAGTFAPSSVSSGERPGARNTMDRMIARYVSGGTPAREARELARGAAIRYDRKR